MIRFEFRGNPTLAPAQDRPGLAALIADITAMSGLEIRRDPAVDFEDWTECAAQLRTVLAAGVETEIRWTEAGVPDPEDDTMAFLDDVDIDDAPFVDDAEDDSRLGLFDFPDRPAGAGPVPRQHAVSGSPCPDAILGALGTRDHIAAEKAGMAWPRPEDKVAERYAEMAAFQRLAGRETLVCDMPGGDPEFAYPEPSPLSGSRPQTSLVEALAAFEGREVAVKQTLPLKAMPIRFLTVEPGKAETAARAVFAEDPYHVLHYEGDRNVLMVQDRVVMTHETRFFVVDGVPVSGAGCVEAHTPLDRDPASVVGVTHAVFERGRNDGEVIRDPAAAAILEDFARRAAAELFAENPEMRFFVVDAALNGAGEPILVEVNPFQNSGLYANDPEAIFGPVVDLIRDAEPSHALDF